MDVYVLVTNLQYDIDETFNIIGVYSTMEKAKNATDHYINNYADENFKSNGIISAYPVKMDSFSFED